MGCGSAPGPSKFKVRTTHAHTQTPVAGSQLGVALEAISSASRRRRNQSAPDVPCSSPASIIRLLIARLIETVCFMRATPPGAAHAFPSSHPHSQAHLPGARPSTRTDTRPVSSSLPLPAPSKPQPAEVSFCAPEIVTVLLSPCPELWNRWRWNARTLGPESGVALPPPSGSVTSARTLFWSQPAPNAAMEPAPAHQE